MRRATLGRVRDAALPLPTMRRPAPLLSPRLGANRVPGRRSARKVAIFPRASHLIVRRPCPRSRPCCRSPTGSRSCTPYSELSRTLRFVRPDAGRRGGDRSIDSGVAEGGQRVALDTRAVGSAMRGWAGNNRWSSVAAAGRRLLQRRRECSAHRSVCRFACVSTDCELHWGQAGSQTGVGVRSDPELVGQIGPVGIVCHS